MLSVPDRMDAATWRAFTDLVGAATDVDGQSPINDQGMVDARSGARDLYFAHETNAASPVVGAAVLGGGELEFVIDPAHRRRGFGQSMLRELLQENPEVSAWAHGDHPASRVLAERNGFTRMRTLRQLRMPLGADPTSASATTFRIGTFHIGTFRTGIDEQEWVALNARIFASHPEQGALTVDDLLAREAETWFDAGDFLIARDETGRMRAYNWLKIEGDLGEVYVIGVDPDAAGRGLGRVLMTAGLDRMRDRGCRTAALYVDDDNPGAAHLYRSMGFSDHTIDVQYRSVRQS